MSKALVIGNGESRRDINLDSYKLEYQLIGCNALHRDITADHLICCDRRMVEEATENPQTKNTLIYVRPEWFHFFRKIKKNKNVRTMPELPYVGDLKQDDPIHWGSGPYAVLVAASLGFKEIELLGFDLYPVNQYVNNLYKDTNNYSKFTAKPVDPKYWIYQISKVFSHYPDTSFVIRNCQTWIIPDEWKKFNVKFLAL